MEKRLKRCSKEIQALSSESFQKILNNEIIDKILNRDENVQKWNVSLN